MSYTIRFRLTDADAYVYAGTYKGGLGIAPQLETAILWSDRATAERFLENGYGRLGEFGEVIEVGDFSELPT